MLGVEFTLKKKQRPNSDNYYNQRFQKEFEARNMQKRTVKSNVQKEIRNMFKEDLGHRSFELINEKQGDILGPSSYYLKDEVYEVFRRDQD